MIYVCFMFQLNICVLTNEFLRIPESPVPDASYISRSESYDTCTNTYCKQTVERKEEKVEMGGANFGLIMNCKNQDYDRFDI